MCHPKSPAHPLILLCSLILGIRKILPKLFLKMNVAWGKEGDLCSCFGESFNPKIAFFPWHVACNYTLFVCLFTWGLSSLLDLVSFKKWGTSFVLFTVVYPHPEECLAYIKGSISTVIWVDKGVFGWSTMCPVSCMTGHCYNLGEDNIFAFRTLRGCHMRDLRFIKPWV